MAENLDFVKSGDIDEMGEVTPYIALRGSSNYEEGMPMNNLDYLPEPDIFHDIAGHVPMHTEQAFADTPVRFGGYPTKINFLKQIEFARGMFAAHYIQCGLALGCARCHDRKYDPVTRCDYYSLFAYADI